MTPADLRSHLRALNLTQAAFAAMIGRNPRTVRSYLSGRHVIPPVIELAVRGLHANGGMP